jgi:hypothetical protein
VHLHSETMSVGSPQQDRSKIAGGIRRPRIRRELSRRDKHYRQLIPLVMATPWCQACGRKAGGRTSRAG